ncbi:hypothetical protein C8Q74DRAFT_552228 [Fomes fomentarius]|nr:hypothetical protein C8Q74DRAFT_552228 [Fomes fomentarius]
MTKACSVTCQDSQGQLQDFVVAQDISTHIIRESPIWPRWRVRIRKTMSVFFFSGHGRAEPQTSTSFIMTIKGARDDGLTVFVAHRGLRAWSPLWSHGTPKMAQAILKHASSPRLSRALAMSSCRTARGGDQAVGFIVQIHEHNAREFSARAEPQSGRDHTMILSRGRLYHNPLGMLPCCTCPICFRRFCLSERTTGGSH